MIKLSLLGESWILINDMNVTTKFSKKTLGLFIYMVCKQQKMYYREALSSLFWPDYTKESSLNNLRHALWQIRKICKELGLEDVLTSEGKHIIRLNVDLVQCDYNNFLNFIQKDDYLNASVLYRGDFLEDFYVPEVPEFSDWVFQERESAQRRYFDIIYLIADRFALNNNLGEATRALKNLTKIDPLNEEVYYKLIKYQYMSGNKVAAINTYRAIKRQLRDELSITPSLELQELYEEIHQETNKTILPPSFELKSMKCTPHDIEIYSLSERPDIKEHYRKLSRYENSSESLVIDLCETPGKRVSYEGLFEMLDGIQDKGKYNPKIYMDKLDGIISKIKHETISNDFFLFDQFKTLFMEELSKNLIIRVWGMHFLDPKTIDFISFVFRKEIKKHIKVIGIYDTTWPNDRLDEFIKAFSE